MISSAQNQKIKLARALTGRPKERREAGAFLAEGARLVDDALSAGWPFRFVLHTEGVNERTQETLRALEKAGVDVESVSPELFQAISDTETPQGVLAVLMLQPLPVPQNPSFFLIPDQVRDPGNLGTLLRTAAAAGVDAVFLPPETADAFAPKVVRAGMGAHFRLPILALSWEEIRAQIGHHPVYLAEMETARSCWETDFRTPLTLVIGGEAEGATETARKLATANVKIPMPDGVESLNAAVAGAILMFEVVRQRTQHRRAR